MTTPGAPEAAIFSHNDTRHPALAPMPRVRRWASSTRAALLAGCVGVLMGCAGNGLSPLDSAQTQNSPPRLVPGNDYDAHIGDSGDAVVDASVATGGGDSVAMSLDVIAPQKADLWHRARTRFVLDSEVDRPRLEREKAWFQRNQAYMDRVADRAQLYLHHIVSEVERRNLPGELALLPVVESAYQPFAYSPARASGNPPARPWTTWRSCTRNSPAIGCWRWPPTIPAKATCAKPSGETSAPANPSISGP